MPSSHFLAKPPLMAVAAISCGKLSLQEEGEATEEKEEEKQEEEQGAGAGGVEATGRDCFSLRRKETREVCQQMGGISRTGNKLQSWQT